MLIEFLYNDIGGCPYEIEFKHSQDSRASWFWHHMQNVSRSILNVNDSRGNAQWIKSYDVMFCNLVYFHRTNRLFHLHYKPENKTWL